MSMAKIMSTALLCVFLFAITAWAETFVVKVVSADDNAPLTNATVFIEESRQWLATDEKGEFSLPAEALDGARITISHVGYFTGDFFLEDPVKMNILKLTPSLSNLDGIVVTANRFDKEAYKVSQPITSVSGTVIRSKGHTIVSDIIRDFPGVGMNDAGPFRARPVIRGLFGTRILVLVDGERLNDQRDVSSFAGVSMSLVDANEIERVEVVNGPSSVLYGSDAMAGVVNIITRESNFSDTFVPYGRYSGRYSTADQQHSNRFDLGFKSDRMSGSIGFLHREALKDFALPDGWNEKSEYEVFRPQFYDSLNAATGRDFSRDRLANSEARTNNYDARLAYKLSDNYRLDADFGIFRGTDIGYPGVPNDSTPFWFFYPEHDRDNFSVSISGKNLSGKLARLNGKFYYEKISKDFLTDFLGSVVIWLGPPGFAPSITPLTSLNQTEVTKYGLNFQELYSVHKRSHLTFGFDFLREEIDGEVTSVTKYTGFGPQPFDSTTVGASVPKNNWHSLGVYVSGETQLEPFTITTGARLDNFWIDTDETPGYADDTGAVLPAEDEHYAALNGSLGITYAITETVNLIANVGTAYRAPNVVERFYYGSASNRETRPNPDIEPERSVSLDFGVKAVHESVNYSLIGFYSDYTNFTQLQKFDSTFAHGSFTPNWRYENIEDVVIYGFEGICEFTAENGIYGSFALTYQHGQNETIDQPLFVSPTKIMLTMGYRHSKHSAFGEMSVKAVEAQDRIPEVAYLDDVASKKYAVLNALAGMKVWKNVRLSVAANNLLDEVYSEPFNSRNPDNPIPEPGRNFIFSVNAAL